MTPVVPVVAILGHPNEGKSSVVSTLTENDQIRVSPTPGETTRSKGYSIRIDQKEVIRFVDTPGFQVPVQALEWFRSYSNDPDKKDPGKIVDVFIREFENDPFYADECELLRPVSKGAGIIYVVDGSRPVRENDLAEIEILRLTGRPRMAIINSKTDQTDYTQQWNLEFRKHFNAIRVFNSNTARFPERIALLESLKSIDQSWEPVLSDVVHTIKQDWQNRNQMVCADMVKTFKRSLSFFISEPLAQGSDVQNLKKEMNKRYEAKIQLFESNLFSRIRSLYKHYLYDHSLPACSILQYDLFSDRTWKFLGLDKKQLAGIGAALGGGIGIIADAAAGGLTFGVLTLAGGLIGAGSALFGGKKAVQKKRAGLRLGGEELQTGPNQNVQFFYILLDRALIYYAHMVGRSHGRRDKGLEKDSGTNKQGYVSGLNMEEKKICARFFKAQVAGRGGKSDDQATQEFMSLLSSVLEKISKGYL